MSTISTCRCNATASGDVPARPRAYQEYRYGGSQGGSGVLAVLTGADAEADKIGSLVPIMPEDMGGPKGYRTLRPILSSGKVRAVGDRVAFVVAETLAAGARRRRADRGRLRAAAGGRSRSRMRSSRARRRSGTMPRATSRSSCMMGNKEATDAAFARRQARRVAQARQQPRLRQFHRAARGDRRISARQTTATRSTPPRRIRTGTARSSPATC